MTYYAELYQSRETGLDDILISGDIKISYHASTQPGLRLLARALLNEHGEDGDLVVTGAGKVIRVSSVVELANLPDNGEEAVSEVATPLLSISRASYEALSGLRNGTVQWQSIAGRLKGYLIENRLVDRASHTVTSLGEAAMQSYREQPDERTKFEAFLALLPLPAKEWEAQIHHKTRGKIEREGWAYKKGGMMVRA